VTEPGYVFLPEQMIPLTHGQHDSRDDSDAIIRLSGLAPGLHPDEEKGIQTERLEV